MAYGNFKLAPALIGGVNYPLFMKITMEEVDKAMFIPPYKGPGVVVRVHTTDSQEVIVDSIIPARVADVKPFAGESDADAFTRKEDEVGSRIAHYLCDGCGVSAAALKGIANTNSFAEWVEAALALLPDGYEEVPVAMTLVYLKKGMLWTPPLRGKGYGPFVNRDPHKLRVLAKHNVTPPIQAQVNPEGEDGITAATPW